eukprot:3731364-Rhodomonas_salina.2
MAGRTHVKAAGVASSSSTALRPRYGISSTDLGRAAIMYTSLDRDVTSAIVAFLGGFDPRAAARQVYVPTRTIRDVRSWQNIWTPRPVLTLRYSTTTSQRAVLSLRYHQVTEGLHTGGRDAEGKEVTVV